MSALLLRAANRLNKDKEGYLAPELLSINRVRQFYLPFHFVAARPKFIETSSDAQLYFHHVATTPDACDQFIQAHCRPGDIVITRDIVFAEKLCLENKAICVMNDRGIEYHSENIFARRRQRDLNLQLRNNALLPSMPNKKDKYGAKDLHCFAACFDRCLTRQIKYQKRYNQSASVS